MPHIIVKLYPGRSEQGKLKVSDNRNKGLILSAFSSRASVLHPYYWQI
jgi:hypothetical protein